MGDLQKKAFIFGSIFTLSNKLQVLGDKFDKSLTIKQWILLAGVFKSESEAPTITEIAKLIGSSRQNVKKMAVILEKSGFVSFEKDQTDARILRICLTEKCKEYLKQREKREEEFLESLFEGFSINEINALACGISKLERNLIELDSDSRNE